MVVNLGITGSDQIGKVIWALVDSGLLTATEDDRPEQFHDLFTLDQLMNARGDKHPRPATT